MLACACDFLLQYIFSWEYVDIGRESLLQHLITWMFAVIQVIGVPFSDKGDYKSRPNSKWKKTSQLLLKIRKHINLLPVSFNCLLTASFSSIKGRGGNSHTSRKVIYTFSCTLSFSTLLYSRGNHRQYASKITKLLVCYRNSFILLFRLCWLGKSINVCTFKRSPLCVIWATTELSSSNFIATFDDFQSSAWAKL